MKTSAAPLAMVTPSFARDLELCRELVYSASEHVPPEVLHYIIVPRRDRSRFRGLETGRTRVLNVEDVVRGARRLPAFKGRWLCSTAALPISGWLVQQLVKMAAADVVEADAVMLVDSDIVFIRDLDVPTFVPTGMKRLYRVRAGITFDKTDHCRWYENACHLLGVAPEEFPVDDYIGHMVTWDVSIVRLVRRHVEAVTGYDWRTAIARARHVSEYILYGLFVDRVLGPKARTWHDDRERCLSIWDAEVGIRPELVEQSAARLASDDVAVSITAHASLMPAARGALLTSIVDFPKRHVDPAADSWVAGR